MKNKSVGTFLQGRWCTGQNAKRGFFQICIHKDWVLEKLYLDEKIGAWLEKQRNLDKESYNCSHCRKSKRRWLWNHMISCHADFPNEDDGKIRQVYSNLHWKRNWWSWSSDEVKFSWLPDSQSYPWSNLAPHFQSFDVDLATFEVDDMIVNMTQLAYSLTYVNDLFKW